MSQVVLQARLSAVAGSVDGFGPGEGRLVEPGADVEPEADVELGGGVGLAAGVELDADGGAADVELGADSNPLDGDESLRGLPRVTARPTAITSPSTTLNVFDRSADERTHCVAADSVGRAEKLAGGDSSAASLAR